MHNERILLGVYRAALAVFFGLVVLGFYVLVTSKTTTNIGSPWQTIHASYVYIFFAITAVLGCLILFSPAHTQLVLGLCVVYSFLLHSYLPLTHEYVYGADQWRHIAVEERLLAHLPPLKPHVVGSGSEAITEQFTILNLESGDFAYSGLWSVSALMFKFFGLSLVSISKWLVPVVWSVSFPVLLLYLGRSFGWTDKKSLLLVWLSALPFALTVNGSLTLPVGWGFLFWLVGLILIFKRLQNPNDEQLYWLGAWAIVLVFNYTLFLLLFALAWGAGELLIRKHNFITLVFVTLAIAFALPALELYAGYSYVNSGVDIFSQTKQFIGNFSGGYIAAGLRPHVIETGNIVFNQIPRYAFVPNVFTVWRWWIPAFMVVFWAAAVCGAGLVFRDRQNKPLVVCASLTIGLTLGYVVDRYFFAGEQVLTRRLDAVLALGYIVMFTLGLRQLHNKLRAYQKGLFVLGLSLAISASYTLGPNLETVSANQYRSMEYVWSQDSLAPRHCVIADTYSLLVLEAVSKRTIVGGGFPIQKNFAQPELTDIVKNQSNDQQKNLEKAMQATGAKNCFVVANVALSRVQFLPVEPPETAFGTYLVWRLPKS